MTLTKITEFIQEKIDWLEVAEDVHVPDQLDGVAEEVRRRFGVDCDVEYIGGFDSPGYDVSCFAFAFADSSGLIGIYGYEHEIY